MWRYKENACTSHLLAAWNLLGFPSAAGDTQVVQETIPHCLGILGEIITLKRQTTFSQAKIKVTHWSLKISGCTTALYNWSALFSNCQESLCNSTNSKNYTTISTVALDLTYSAYTKNIMNKKVMALPHVFLYTIYKYANVPFWVHELKWRPPTHIVNDL